MSSKIISFNSRLRRLEKKARVKPLDFFTQQSDDVLFAILEIPLGIADEDEPEYYAKKLNWSVKKAESFVASLNQLTPVLVTEFRNKSDSELEAFVCSPFEDRP